MRVELTIRGLLWHVWEFENADYYDQVCKVNNEERAMLWARVIENCKREVQHIVDIRICEFHIVVPARIQPADVDPEEQEKFLQQIIENQNSSI